jgi:hypothetical protein
LSSVRNLVSKMWTVYIEKWFAGNDLYEVQYPAARWLFTYSRRFFFYLWVLHPVAHLSNWFTCDSVNRNKVSIRHSPFFIFLHSLHVSAPMGHLQVRYTIRCFYGLFLLQRIRWTYTTWRIDIICINRYFDSWSLNTILTTLWSYKGSRNSQILLSMADLKGQRE